MPPRAATGAVLDLLHRDIQALRPTGFSVTVNMKATGLLDHWTMD